MLSSIESELHQKTLSFGKISSTCFISKILSSKKIVLRYEKLTNLIAFLIVFTLESQFKNLSEFFYKYLFFLNLRFIALRASFSLFFECIEIRKPFFDRLFNISKDFF